MTTIYTFSDGNELIAYTDGGYSADILYVYNNNNDETYLTFEDDYIIFSQSYDSKTEHTLCVKLVGFDLDTDSIIKNVCLNPHELEQITYIYELSKDFIHELDNLCNIRDYIASCENFDDIEIKHYPGHKFTSLSYSNCYLVVHGTVNPELSQQECEKTITEFIGRLVIYNNQSQRLVKSSIK